MTNIQHCPLPLDGNNEQAPDLIIGVVGRLLSHDQQVSNPDGPNASATAVESTDDTRDPRPNPEPIADSIEPSPD